MTSTERRQDQLTEVFDLYDVLPEEPSPASSDDNDPVGRTVYELGRTFAALVGTFAVALVAFVAGFVTLVVRMKPRNPDSGPDDGAVV